MNTFKGEFLDYLLSKENTYSNLERVSNQIKSTYSLVVLKARLKSFIEAPALTNI